MSKITAIVVTAAICLPLGALLRRDASAQVTPAQVRVIEGHRHLSRAQAALHDALKELDLSRQSGEMVWTDRSGRVEATTEALTRATLAFDQMASWVAEGMAQNNVDERNMRRINALHAPRSTP
jgi:hypothetical protein